MAKTKWLNEQETLARFPHRIGVKTLENFPTDLLRRTHRWKKDRCPRCGQVTLEKQRFYLAQHVRWLARAAEHEPHSVKVAAGTVRQGAKHQAGDSRRAVLYLRKWKRTRRLPKEPWARCCGGCGKRFKALARPKGEPHHSGVCPGCLKRHVERRASWGSIQSEAEDLLRGLVDAGQEEILGSPAPVDHPVQPIPMPCRSKP